jgi:hypothetical protein
MDCGIATGALMLAIHRGLGLAPNRFNDCLPRKSENSWKRIFVIVCCMVTLLGYMKPVMIGKYR